MLLMCAVKERVLLRMVPRLLIWGEGWTIELSIGNKKLSNLVDLVPMRNNSSLLSLRKLWENKV